MRRAAILALAAAVLLSGCSSETERPAELYSGMNLDSLPGYRATFNMTFDGDRLWSYHLETQSDGGQYAYDLSLEGLGPIHDPGDVRLVHSDGTNRMRGQGTDDECVQFPDSIDIGMLFLTPDEIFDPNMLNAPMVAFEEDQVAGQETVHYSLQQTDLLTWQDVSLDLWISVDDGATLRYELSANGPDPLFSGGEGHLVGEFMVLEIGGQSITPIEGCQIDFPLPDGYEDLVRLPDLLAFESQLPPESLAGWYQTALEEAGWSPFAEMQTTSGSVQLSYQREAEQAQIRIGASDTGSQVEIIFQVEE